MTTPLSDEQLAALRERWERGDAVGWSDAIDTIGEAVQTIAVLLDEVERLRAENGRLLTELLDADRYVGGAETDMEMLRARVARLEGVLRSVEWALYIGDSRAFGTTVYECPYCREWKSDGHAPDCALDAALRGEQ